VFYLEASKPSAKLEVAWTSRATQLQQEEVTVSAHKMLGVAAVVVLGGAVFALSSKTVEPTGVEIQGFDAEYPWGLACSEEVGNKRLSAVYDVGGDETIVDPPSLEETVQQYVSGRYGGDLPISVELAEVLRTDNRAIWRVFESSQLKAQVEFARTPSGLWHINGYIACPEGEWAPQPAPANGDSR
jgi:hypothetical protein